MEKTDLRIMKSKNALQASFIELLNKKRFSKITVDELCKLACVNRMTFYNHYQDKYDLFNDIIEKLKTNLIIKFLEYAQNDFSVTNIPNLLYKISELAIDECLIHQNIILSITNDDESSLIQYIISNSLNDSIVKVLQSLSSKTDTINKIPLMASFLTGGITSLIIHFLENEKKYKREELNNIIRDLISHSYNILIN